MVCSCPSKKGLAPIPMFGGEAEDSDPRGKCGSLLERPLPVRKPVLCPTLSLTSVATPSVCLSVCHAVPSVDVFVMSGFSSALNPRPAGLMAGRQGAQRAQALAAPAPPLQTSGLGLGSLSSSAAEGRGRRPSRPIGCRESPIHLCPSQGLAAPLLQVATPLPQSLPLALLHCPPHSVLQAPGGGRGQLLSHHSPSLSRVALGSSRSLLGVDGEEEKGPY